MALDYSEPDALSPEPGGAPPPIPMDATSPMEGPAGFGPPPGLSVPDIPRPDDSMGRNFAQNELMRLAMSQFFEKTFMPVMNELYPEFGEQGMRGPGLQGDSLAGGGLGGGPPPGLPRGGSGGAFGGSPSFGGGIGGPPPLGAGGGGGFGAGTGLA